jgi:hypothetical protein
LARAVDDTGAAITLTPADGEPLGGKVDHTAYHLVNVDPEGAPQLRLAGALPQGTKGAVALVGRTGPEVGGTANVQITRLAHGGGGVVTLDNPAQYSRITAVIINSDFSKAGYSSDLGDWVFKRDQQNISLALNDQKPPRITSRSPGTNKKGVSTGSKVSIKFSEVVLGANSKTVKLTTHGSTVRARISVGESGGNSLIKIKPSKRLRGGTKYTVKVGSLTDAAGNKLTGSRSWSFTTKR